MLSMWNICFFVVLSSCVEMWVCNIFLMRSLCLSYSVAIPMKKKPFVCIWNLKWVWRWLLNVCAWIVCFLVSLLSAAQHSANNSFFHIAPFRFPVAISSSDPLSLCSSLFVFPISSGFECYLFFHYFLFKLSLLQTASLNSFLFSRH